jgi:hypothetical protein
LLGRLDWCLDTVEREWMTTGAASGLNVF